MVIRNAFRSFGLSLLLCITSVIVAFEYVLDSIKSVIEPTIEYVVESITAAAHVMKVTVCRDKPQDNPRCDNSPRQHVSMLKSLGGGYQYA